MKSEINIEKLILQWVVISILMLTLVTLYQNKNKGIESPEWLKKGRLKTKGIISWVGKFKMPSSKNNIESYSISAIESYKLLKQLKKIAIQDDSILAKEFDKQIEIARQKADEEYLNNN